MGLHKKVISYLKNKIRNTVRENDYTVNYLPYNKTVNDYIITKSKLNYPKSESGLSVPGIELRSGYAKDNAEYLKSGEEDISNMMNILNSHGFDLKSEMKVIDFGCSSGRMIRHLKKYASQNEIWGTDVSCDHIYWCNQYLNPPFQFLTSTFNAHLPFEDKYFDLIYSGSVFTHIDNIIESWLMELRRILSGNGMIYITIHDNHTMEFLEKNNAMVISEYVVNHPLYNKAKKDFDFFVLNRSKSPQVFFDLEYFRKLVRQMFDIVSVNKESYGYQTGVVLKRKK